MTDRGGRDGRSDGMDHGMHDTSHHGGGDYEREDFGPKAIFTFLAGLGVFALLIILVVMGVFRALDSYTIAHMKSGSPLVTVKAEDYTRHMAEKDILQFPAPRLDGGERPGDLNSQRQHEESVFLAPPAWSESAPGEVHIPLAEAMALIAERGLPARAEGSTAQPAASVVVKAGAKPGAKQSGIVKPVAKPVMQ